MPHTVVVSPQHILPLAREMPALKDPLGGGFEGKRRRYTLPLGRWEIAVPGHPEDLEGLAGLLEYMQGDTPFWFDCADFGEILEPRIFGEGNGSDTDFKLPHRHVFVSSLVVSMNGEIFTSWAPLGGDGIICDDIRISPAPAAKAQLTARYRRKARVCLETEEGGLVHEVQFTDPDNPRRSFYNMRFLLKEQPT